MFGQRKVSVLVVAAGVAAAALMWAPAASAAPNGSIVDNGDGTLTVTYAGFTASANLLFCPTTVATGSCAPVTSSYLFSSDVGTNPLPSSPASIVAGMAVTTGNSGLSGWPSTTLAAGTYNVRLDNGAGSQVAVLANAVVGTGGGGGTSSGTGGSSPAPVVQQFGKPVAGTCEASAPVTLNWGGAGSGGWGESWAQWMNGGNGGAVCTRTLVYSTAQSRWVTG